MKLVFLLLAAALPALAAPADPGKAAVDFLEKVRRGKLNLEPGGDTALSPHTAEAKRREIGRRLERMARDLGTDSLEVGAVKEDENFAAVLVRKVGGFDPSRLQVFPLALVKRGENWTVAPVPASFENSGLGYAATLRQRLEMLENWMLREQVVDLEKLREQSADRMRREIAKSLPPEELRKLSAGEVADRFLTACREKSVPVMLGCQGGLAATQPENWQLRLKAAEDAITRTEGPWHLLIAPEIVRVIVGVEPGETESMVSIACLDPAGKGSSPPRVELVHFPLEKTRDGFWQINLPSRFLTPTPDAGDEDGAELDSDLLDEFPKKLRENFPADSLPTAREAAAALVKALENDSPLALLAGLNPRADGKAGRRECGLAARAWWAIHDPAAVRLAVHLGFHEEEKGAVAIYQFFSARDPDHEDFRIFFFERTGSGWLWSMDAPGNHAVWKNLRGRASEEITKGTGHWQEPLLVDSFALDHLAAGSAPSPEEARATVEIWLKAVRSGDMKGALAVTARLTGPASPSRSLRNLGHEILMARRASTPETIAAVHQGKTWTAVATGPTQTLYPVISTEKGPRILLEIDLQASSTRSRDFLNRAALDRLRGFAAPEVTAELRDLLDSHSKAAK